MIDRIGADLNFEQQALGLRKQRQEVLAANIANADTPNYKARDFDFASALRTAVDAGGLRLPDTYLSLTASRHIPGRAVTPDPSGLLYRQPYQPSLDGNTVDMDAERVQFADNTLRYQAGLAFVSARIKALTAALQH